MTNDSEKYWYNLETGAVERGYESPAIDRAGPFDTAEEAASAPQLMRDRSRAWADEEARESGWSGVSPAPTESDTDDK